jgi:hypothetical protein
LRSYIFRKKERRRIRVAEDMRGRSQVNKNIEIQDNLMGLRPLLHISHQPDPFHRTKNKNK